MFFLSERVWALNCKSVLLVCFVICSVAALFSVAEVLAAPVLNLSFYKDNGFGMGNDMNGEWTLNAAVSQNVSRVEFYLDNQLQENDTAAPFSWSFNTGNYTEGAHTFKAIAYDSSGESATASAERSFVGFPVSFVVGIIVLAVVVLAVSLVFTWFWIKKKAHEQQRTHKTQ